MSKTLQEMTLDFQARIQELAYLMWEQAGQQQGTAVQYWLEAEKQALAAMHAATSHVISGLREPAAPAEAGTTPAAAEAPDAPLASAPPAAAAGEPLPAPSVQEAPPPAAPPAEAAVPPAKPRAARKPAARRKSKN